MEGKNDKMASAHNDFEILMKYPSRAVQKIGENPASYSLNILFSFFSPNKSQLVWEQRSAQLKHSPLLDFSLPRPFMVGHVNQV